MDLPKPTDVKMWRMLLARCHPDAGGDHELFVWAQSVREKIEGKPEAKPVHRQASPRGPVVVTYQATTSAAGWYRGTGAA